jgi:hypothetical protein
VTWDSTDGVFSLNPLPQSQIKGEIQIDKADLENSIYSTLGSATIVDPSNQIAPFTIGTGANNQWGTVLTQFLTGFTGGFFLNTGQSRNSQVTAPIDLNQNLNWDPFYAFQPLSPYTFQTNDPYSKVFYFNSNSYGSGYSDALMSSTPWAGR